MRRLKSFEETGKFVIGYVNPNADKMVIKCVFFLSQESFTGFIFTCLT